MTNLKEYSKRIVQQMIDVWFIGVKFGILLVSIEMLATIILLFVPNSTVIITVHLPELLTYIGAPVSGGILGYLLKAAFENREKIKNFFNKEAPHEEYSDASSDRCDLGQSGEENIYSI